MAMQNISTASTEGQGRCLFCNKINDNWNTTCTTCLFDELLNSKDNFLGAVDMGRLELRASELEAASKSLISEHARHRKPTHNQMHVFFARSASEEFGQSQFNKLLSDVDALQQTSESGQISRRRKANVLESDDLSRYIHPYEIKGAFSSLLWNKIESIDDGAPPHNALLRKLKSLLAIHRSSPSTEKSTSFLPASVYSLARCGSENEKLCDVAFNYDNETDDLPSQPAKVLLVVFWRPLDAIGVKIAQHYEALASQFPDLFTVVHIVHRIYTEEEAYFDGNHSHSVERLLAKGRGGLSEGGDVGGVSHVFKFDSRDNDFASLLTSIGRNEHSLGKGSPNTRRAAQPTMLPTVLMCVAPETVHASHPRFYVEGSWRQHFCHSILFASQGENCLSQDTCVAAASLARVYGESQGNTSSGGSSGSREQLSARVREMRRSWVRAPINVHYAKSSIEAFPSLALQGNSLYAANAQPDLADFVVPNPKICDESVMDDEPCSKQQNFDFVKALLLCCKSGAGESLACTPVTAFIEKVKNGPQAVQGGEGEGDGEAQYLEALRHMVQGDETPAKFLPFLLDKDSEQSSQLTYGMLVHLQARRSLAAPDELGGGGRGNEGKSVESMLVESVVDTRQRNLERIEHLSESFDVKSEPPWVKIYHFLRLGMYQEAHQAVADTPITSIGMGNESSFGDDNSSISRGSRRSLNRSSQFEKMKQQRTRVSPEDPKTLLGNVRKVLKALTSSKNGRLPEKEVEGCVQESVRGIWQYVMEQHRVINTRQRREDHARRHDVDGMEGGSGSGSPSRYATSGLSYTVATPGSPRTPGTPLTPGTPGVSSISFYPGSPLVSGSAAGTPSMKSRIFEESSIHSNNVSPYNAAQFSPQHWGIYKHCVLLLLSACGGSLECFELKSVHSLISEIKKISEQESTSRLKRNEDTLWAYTWTIYWGQQFYQQLPSGVTEPYHGLTTAHLYDMYCQNGGSSAPEFDGEKSFYVLVLFGCQQFSAAVAFLQGMLPTRDVAIQIACACVYFGLLHPLDFLAREISQDGNVVDVSDSAPVVRGAVFVRESDVTVAKFVEKYVSREASVVSATYLSLLLVPQCIYRSRDADSLGALLPENCSKIFDEFKNAMERLHFRKGSFRLVNGRPVFQVWLNETVRHNIGGIAFSNLVLHLGRRMLVDTSRVLQAIKFYASLDTESSPSHGKEELLRDLAVELQGVLFPSPGNRRAMIRSNAKWILSHEYLLGQNWEKSSEYVCTDQEDDTLALCRDVFNLESFCQVADLFLTIDIACSNGHVVVRDCIRLFTLVKWAFCSTLGSRSLNKVNLLPVDDGEFRRIEQFIAYQHDSNIRVYSEILVHVLSYLQRLEHCVLQGVGSSGNSVQDHNECAQLRAWMEVVSALQSLAFNAAAKQTAQTRLEVASRPLTISVDVRDYGDDDYGSESDEEPGMRLIENYASSDRSSFLESRSPAKKASREPEVVLGDSATKVRFRSVEEVHNIDKNLPANVHLSNPMSAGGAGAGAFATPFAAPFPTKQALKVTTAVEVPTSPFPIPPASASASGVRYEESESLGDGDCFYSSLFRAARAYHKNGESLVHAIYSGITGRPATDLGDVKRDIAEGIFISNLRFAVADSIRVTPTHDSIFSEIKVVNQVSNFLENNPSLSDQNRQNIINNAKDLWETLAERNSQGQLECLEHFVAEASSQVAAIFVNGAVPSREDFYRALADVVGTQRNYACQPDVEVVSHLLKGLATPIHIHKQDPRNVSAQRIQALEAAANMSYGEHAEHIHLFFRLDRRVPSQEHYTFFKRIN